MPNRDPLTFPYPKGTRRLDSLDAALKSSQKRPITGVTQGGSSRRNSGAKVAATTAKFKPAYKRKTKL